MKYGIFVDGLSGTTGLKIRERLEGRSDLSIMKIDPEKRRDPGERKKYLNEADIVFLCLPDPAAKEAVSLVENDRTRIIDASTAHRTNPGWTYGFPELDREQRARIAASRRVAVPGCHATGFIAGLVPLLRKGVVPLDYPLTCHSVTGYSGGGKELIAKYEAALQGAPMLNSPRHYALGLRHKHLPEMQAVAGLAFPPLFTPIVGNFAQGMGVAVPLLSRLLPGKPSAKDIHAVLSSWYEGERFVKVIPFDSEAYLNEGFFEPASCNGTNRLEIFVFGHDEQILVLSRFDNLGKGASGAAVQNMNIMLGLEETTGLRV